MRATAFLSLAWMGLVMICLQWVGHQNPTVAFFLFLPAWLWAIPCLAMLLPGLVLDPLRSGAPLLIAILIYLGPFLGYRFGAGANGQAPPGVPTLKVLTFNRGQSQGTSLQPFKNQWQPDILALQDSGGRAQGYLQAPGYSDFSHGDSSGEFLLLSKFPILSTTPITCEVPDLEHGGTQHTAVAARFEIDWKGTKIAIYNVHLPTHRGMLVAERNGGFLAGVLGLPGTPWAAKRHHREAYWNITMEQIRQLSDRVAKETIPTLLMGDLNNPPFGPFYQTLGKPLADSHTEAGKGYGFSFPGTTNNPLALFQPWLRIDYIFHSRGHWTTIKQVTETNRGSQHLAVFAEFSKTPTR